MSNWPTRRRSRVAAVALVVLMALTVTGAAAAQGPGVPRPAPGVAMVSLYVGDVRTSPTSIGPLEGARFGLFFENPEASIDDHDGFTREAPAYECVSAADGYCTFEVPIGEGGVPANTRMWVAATGAGPDHYANPWWQTGPLSPSAQDPLHSLRHVYQTPPLQQNQSYVSGEDWITDPGQQTDPPTMIPGRPGDQESFRRRTASGGTTPLSRHNPDFDADCGLNIAISVDLSSSMSGRVGQLKTAMDSFVDSLQGTPSQAALFTSGTDSPANGYGPNVPLRSVSTASDVAAFKNLYASWGDPPTNYTNWDRGIGTVADYNATLPEGQKLDMVVLLTDGNPTVYGPIADANTNNPRIPENSGYTRFRELGNALASANLIKSQGTRMLAVGVGANISSPGAAYNLRTISGRDPYTGPESIREADYMQQADYAQVGQALRSLVLSGCAPSVSVIKQVVPHDGTVADAYTPSEPWNFAAQPQAPGTSVTPREGATDPHTGGINFDMEIPPEQAPARLRLEEDPRTAAGYTPMPEETTCVNKTTDNTPVQTTPDPEAPDTAFTVPVGLEDAVSCVVYNRAPDFDAASVRVRKQWEVTTAAGPGETTTRTYANGEQPSQLQSNLLLDGPGGVPASRQGWGDPRAGYDLDTDSPVQVTENVDLAPPGCELTGADIRPTEGGAATPVQNGQPTAMPLASGENDWTITNRVDCRSRLMLHKEVASGTGEPQWWTLDALRPDGALPGPSGRDTTELVEVTPNVNYQLAETPDQPGGDVPHEVLHYVQNDLRGRPLAFPESTGSWDCHLAGDPSGEEISTGVEGAVAVPLGQDVECTAVNQTAWLNVVKRVEGGDARPSDFIARVAPLQPAPPGAHAHDVPAGPEPGARLTVRPRQRYELTELRGPEGYRPIGLDCTSGDLSLAPEDFTIEPGGAATCVLTNRRMSEMTVLKRDSDTSAPLPGAVFDLYRDSDGDGEEGMTGAGPDPQDERIGTCTTADGGRCSLGELDFGDYYWHERQAPEGYEFPPDRTGPITPIDADNAGQPHLTTFDDPRTPPTPPDPPTPPEPEPPMPEPNPTSPPSSSEPPAPPQFPAPPGAGGGLATTGVQIGLPFALGVLLAALGTIIAVAVRRRR